MSTNESVTTGERAGGPDLGGQDSRGQDSRGQDQNRRDSRGDDGSQTDVMICLREGTRQQHEALHEVVGGHHMTRSLEDYARCLRAYERAVAPIETGLKRFARERASSSSDRVGNDLRLDDLDRRLVKTRWLQSDLDFLCPKIDPKDWCERLPIPALTLELADRDQWFGCMYVTEGMTLGARFIAPEIENAFSLPEAGLSFFRAYGEDTSAMWNRFRDAARRNVVDLDAAVRAAQQTFDWFANHLSADFAV